MNRDKEFIVSKIRTEYQEKESSKLNELKMLDAKVKRPATVFSYIFGSVGAIIMGSGMSLTMTDIGLALGISAGMPIGIAIGVVGLLMAMINYPIYNKLLSSRRRKYKDEILALSEGAINE